jgi:hypothetical protein
MNRYQQMELLCRQHADLDEQTAESWLAEAEIWSKLVTIEHRLQILKANKDERGKIPWRKAGRFNANSESLALSAENDAKTSNRTRDEKFSRRQTLTR